MYNYFVQITWLYAYKLYIVHSSSCVLCILFRLISKIHMCTWCHFVSLFNHQNKQFLWHFQVQFQHYTVKPPFIEIVFIPIELNLTLCNLYTILSYCLKEDFIATTLSSVVAIKSSLRKYDKMVYKLQRVKFNSRRMKTIEQ